MQNSLLQGTLDVLILKALVFRPQHGYAVARWIRETTDGTLSVEDGALYAALHRMEQRSWIESEWGLSENNRQAMYYALAPLGRKQLRHELSTWARFAEAVGKIVRATEKPAWVQG